MINKIDIVINYIKNNIANGTWKKGDRIFGEIDLSKRLNVGRNTVREALSILNKENIIIKKTGSGSYISDAALCRNNKYIIISIREGLLFDIAGFTYRSVLDLLKELIIEANYIPFIYLEHKDAQIMDFINIDPSEIAGVISVIGFDNIFDKLIEKDIPVVSCLNTITSPFPSVITDYVSLYNSFKNIIIKYKLNNCLTVLLEKDISEGCDLEVLVHNIMPKYITNSKNDLLYIPYDDDFKLAPKLLKEKLLSLEEIPDVIVFTDDCIFVAASKIFSEMSDILQKTKIITHTNSNRDYFVDFPVCKLEFNMKELAEKTFKLLMQHINKEYVPQHNISIIPKVINEEIFQK